MARIEKTVFISYRRADVYTALAVYENLKNQGYNVFFDYRSISSGDFEQIISSNIKARAHFLLILTPTALDRCNEPGDWLRREIEIAINERRNIIPLFFRGFRFGDPAVTEKLTGTLLNLNRYNGLNVHEDYFDEAMHRLRMQYLSIPLNTVLHPISTEVQKIVKEEQVAADKALEQIEDVQELVKQPNEKLNQFPEPDPIPKFAVSAPIETPSEKQPETPGTVVDHSTQHEGVRTKPEEILREDAAYLKPVLKKAKFDVAASQDPLKKAITIPKLRFRLIGGIIGGILFIALFIWAGASKFNNQPMATREPARTPQIEKTQMLEPSKTIAPFSTNTLTATTNVSINTSEPMITPLGIGSTMTGKDGMTLLYVPAGEFTMGSDSGEYYEKPVHKVNLDAFWIDQTEVTNAMYKQCVQDGTCKLPRSSKSFTRDSYFDNSEFYNYPVVYVSWDDAKSYCSWANRRLPTEAEWEKAARGEDARNFPWGIDFDGTRLNYCDKNCRTEVFWRDKYFDDGFVDTAPVGNFLRGASPYGALDMAGNVWEWVADWYRDYYYTSSPKENPPGPDQGSARVIRGGSFADPYNYSCIVGRYYGPGDPCGTKGDMRVWIRHKDIPNATSQYYGFRCAMSAMP